MSNRCWRSLVTALGILAGALLGAWLVRRLSGCPERCGDQPAEQPLASPKIAIPTSPAPPAMGEIEIPLPGPSVEVSAGAGAGSPAGHDAGSAQADDLTRISGIGPKYAETLAAAGITTFRRLAASEPAALAAIISAPAWRKVDFASWIAQAATLAVE